MLVIHTLRKVEACHFCEGLEYVMSRTPHILLLINKTKFKGWNLSEFLAVWRINCQQIWYSQFSNFLLNQPQNVCSSSKTSFSTFNDPRAWLQSSGYPLKFSRYLAWSLNHKADLEENSLWFILKSIQYLLICPYIILWGAEPKELSLSETFEVQKTVF